MHISVQKWHSGDQEENSNGLDQIRFISSSFDDFNVRVWMRYQRKFRRRFSRSSARWATKVVGESAQTKGFKCAASSIDESIAFIAELKRMYPAEWRVASRVTFAPKYKVTLGSTEILLLERGVVMITDVDGKRQVLFQQGNIGEIEQVVRRVCPAT